MQWHLQLQAQECPGISLSEVYKEARHDKKQQLMDTWKIAQTAKVTKPSGWHDYESSQDCKEHMRVQCHAPNGQMCIGE